jgi:transcription elongation factor Elf1
MTGTLDLIMKVQPKRGIHCDPKVTHHYECPACDAPFCSSCMKKADVAGAVLCPRCNVTIYFASAADAPVGN